MFPINPPTPQIDLVAPQISFVQCSIHRNVRTHRVLLLEHWHSIWLTDCESHRKHFCCVYKRNRINTLSISHKRFVFFATHIIGGNNLIRQTISIEIQFTVRWAIRVYTSDDVWVVFFLKKTTLFCDQQENINRMLIGLVRTKKVWMEPNKYIFVCSLLKYKKCIYDNYNI